MRDNSIYPQYSDRPRFVDRLAVEVVVHEHRYMKLTSAERQLAAKELSAQGLDNQKIAQILKVTDRSVVRMLGSELPPLLDVDEDGWYIDENGERTGRSSKCLQCERPPMACSELCKTHRESQLRRERRQKLGTEAVSSIH